MLAGSLLCLAASSAVQNSEMDLWCFSVVGVFLVARVQRESKVVELHSCGCCELQSGPEFVWIS